MLKNPQNPKTEGVRKDFVTNSSNNEQSEKYRKVWRLETAQKESKESRKKKKIIPENPSKQMIIQQQ